LSLAPNQREMSEPESTRLRAVSMSRLAMSNFLSLGSEGAEFHLGNLNVLVGPNGSGKTNLFEAIRILRTAPRDFGFPMNSNGGVEAYLWRGVPRATLAKLQASISVNPLPTTYRHEIGFGSDSGRTSIHIETMRPEFEGDGEEFIETLEREPEGLVNRLRTKTGSIYQSRSVVRLNESGIEKARDSSAFPILASIADYYESIKIYSDWTMGRDSPTRRPVAAGTPSDVLLEDSSNLAFVLAELRSTAALPKIREALGRLKETYADFSIRPVGGQLQLYVEEDGILGGINSIRLSDGTLRFLALTAVLLHPNPAPMIVIDEPEIGMHPDLIEAIAEMIIEASSRTQLIIATHSPELLSCLRTSIDRLYAFQSSTIGSVVRGFSREELGEYLADTPLGELWKQGDLGGNRF